MVKVSINVVFFAGNSPMEFFINLAMKGINAAITDHFVMLFRNVVPPSKLCVQTKARVQILSVRKVYECAPLPYRQRVVLRMGNVTKQVSTGFSIVKRSKGGNRRLRKHHTSAGVFLDRKSVV